MAKTLPDDILLPASEATPPRRSPLAAFVPIVIALFGVAAILFGGVSARDLTATEGTAAIDPIATGAIVSEPQTQSVPGHIQRWE